MFTGIIEAVGTVKAININGQGARVVIATGKLDMQDVKLGDSIATNGIFVILFIDLRILILARNLVFFVFELKKAPNAK